MIRKWLGVSVPAVMALVLLNTSGCARDQKLTSITLSPSQGFIFEGPNAAGQFTAYGNYIHPPETKDISTLVTWSLNIANFRSVSSDGLVTYTRTDGCGSGQITATYNNSDGSVVVASASVAGANNSTSLCQ